MTLPNDHSGLALEDISDYSKNGPIQSEGESLQIMNAKDTNGYLAQHTGESHRSG